MFRVLNRYIKIFEIFAKRKFEVELHQGLEEGPATPKHSKMSGPDRQKQLMEELQQEVSFRDKIIRKLELRILEKEEEILQLRSDLDKVSPKFRYYSSL